MAYPWTGVSPANTAYAYCFEEGTPFQRGAIFADKDLGLKIHRPHAFGLGFKATTSATARVRPHGFQVHKSVDHEWSNISGNTLQSFHSRFQYPKKRTS